MLCDIQDLAAHRDGSQRLMGIDLGEKTIGIAISDPTWCIATPVSVIRRTNRAADREAILNLVDQHQVQAVIVGLPINMNGSFGPQAEKMREFACSLADLSQLMVVLWDERLSTVAVNRTLLSADMSRKRRGKVVDKLAATYILQGALDRLRIVGSSPSSGRGEC